MSAQKDVEMLYVETTLFVIFWEMVWIDDGSGAATGDGAVVRIAAESAGCDLFNALWRPADASAHMTNGEYCWKFTVISGCVNVGVSTEKHFQKSYRCRGLFYNGGTSNGGSQVTDRFGPHPKEGDVVYITVCVSDELLEMGVSINGRSLGSVFKIAAPFDKPLFPVASCIGSSCKGSVSIEPCATVPSGWRTWAPENADNMYSDWESVPEAENETAKLNITPQGEGGSEILINLRVRNILTARGIHQGGNKYSSKGISTTLAMTPPHLAAMEAKCGNLLEKLETISLDSEAGMLTMTGGGHTVKFRRASHGPGPASVNPLKP